MGSRLDNLPVYKQSSDTLAAEEYNRVLIALKRFGEPIRISLAGLRTLELVLDHEAWIVVDNAFNDIPVLAWTEFEVSERQTLHEPISCTLKMYHAHAKIILDEVHDQMGKVLMERIEKLHEGAGGDRVVPIKNKNPARNSGKE